MRSALTLVLVLALTCVPLEASADVSNDWATVQMLPAGITLKVVSDDGKNFAGTLTAASEMSLTVTKNAKETVVLREDTRRVYVVGGRNIGGFVGKGTLIGAAGGAAGGAVAGRGSCTGGEPYCAFRVATTIVLGVAGAAVGAVTGVVIGAFRHKKQLVYENR